MYIIINLLNKISIYKWLFRNVYGGRGWGFGHAHNTAIPFFHIEPEGKELKAWAAVKCTTAQNMILL